jgi:CHASE3 domain sensor protein
MGKKTFIAWFCLSLAMVATSCLFIFEEKLRLNLDRIAQAQEALYLIHDLQANLFDAEVVTRGYIITDEDENLEGVQIF